MPDVRDLAQQQICLVVISTLLISLDRMSPWAEASILMVEEPQHTLHDG